MPLAKIFDAVPRNQTHPRHPFRNQNLQRKIQSHGRRRQHQGRTALRIAEDQQLRIRHLQSGCLSLATVIHQREDLPRSSPREESSALQPLHRRRGSRGSKRFRWALLRLSFRTSSSDGVLDRHYFLIGDLSEKRALRLRQPPVVLQNQPHQQGSTAIRHVHNNVHCPAQSASSRHSKKTKLFLKGQFELPGQHGSQVFRKVGRIPITI